jgi:hypothetical protein
MIAQIDLTTSDWRGHAQRTRGCELAPELGWVYGDSPTVVVTGREWPAARKSVEFYAGDLKEA